MVERAVSRLLTPYLAMRNPSRSVHSPRRVSDDAVPICTGTTTDLDTVGVARMHLETNLMKRVFLYP